MDNHKADMDDTNGQAMPAQRADLVAMDASHETFLYDQKRFQGFALNEHATLVWQKCDGQTPIHRVIDEVAAKAGQDVAPAVVWQALHRLHKAGLLASEPQVPPKPMFRSRRAFLQFAGAMAVCLPVVTSVLVPLPALAASTITPAACSASPSGTGPPTCGTVCTNSAKKCQKKVAGTPCNCQSGTVTCPC